MDGMVYDGWMFNGEATDPGGDDVISVSEVDISVDQFG